jgi:CHAT domain-containing protein
VGDPILSDSSALFSGLSPLQNAAAELSSINLSLGSDNEIITQENATKENLLSLTNKSYRFVHFATHGVFNEESPQYSGLILSPDANQNNFLSVSDIFEMNLPCEMVTLSACSSALGDNVSGEGIVGLTRGFIYAGAQSVCSTLWDVSGESTAEFMTDFYKLLANDIDKGTALAKTKREMIASSELAHPFFWGAFVLSGEN